MSDKTFLLDIVSPSKKVFSGNAISLSAPGFEGGFQILHNHTEFITPLKLGEIELVIDPAKTYHYATSGGIIEVHQNKVVILAETIERSDQIDPQRAQASAERAMKRIDEPEPEVYDIFGKKLPGFEVPRAKIALSKAQNRLKVFEKFGA